MSNTNRCFFSACKTPVTHTVQRLWSVKGKPLPLQHCCEKHIPGSFEKKFLHTPTFYRVERLS